jgi:hypothetical protein
VRPRCAHSAKREREQARTEQNKSCNGYCEKTEGGDLITHAKSWSAAVLEPRRRISVRTTRLGFFGRESAR